MKRTMKALAAVLCAPALLLGLLPGAASGAQARDAQQYRNKIANDMSQCAPGAGPAVRVTIRGVREGSGMIRVQAYRATKADWLEKGKWINRIEMPARKGNMTFCVPLPGPGAYAIAARHDTNGNGKTDIMQDGGAMSNNPSINIFNLGKPGIDKTRFEIGDGVERMSITMLYLS
jgi:uncharacterized protein (DUF2141 family)